MKSAGKFMFNFLRIIVAVVLIVAGGLKIYQALGGDADIPSTKAEETMSEDDYKSACVEPDYKEFLRYPDKYKGTKVRIKVQIKQTINGNWRAQDDSDGYGWYMGDEYYLSDKRGSDAVKILEDDILIVYGDFSGLKEITRSLTGVQDEVPRINVRYADIVEDSPEDSYAEILEEYSKKMRDATPTLIAEFHEEAKNNANGIMGLAEISNQKVSVLAEISTEGVQKMAKVMYASKESSYEEYSNWAGKLQDVYMEEAGKIQDVYMKAAS